MDGITKIQIDDLIKLNGIANIKLSPWRAKGDSVTDESIIINDFLQYCISYGKVAYFPKGIYRYCNPIIYNNSRKSTGIIGDGFNESFLKFDGDGDTWGIKFLNSRLFSKNICFTNTTSHSPTVIFGNVDNKVDFVHLSSFDNVWFTGFPNAVQVGLMYDTDFIDCYWDSPVDIYNVTPGACFDILPNQYEISNNIHFTRCHSEGSMANTIQFRAVGYNTMRHKCIDFNSCHFETANKSTQAFYLENCDNININNGRYISNSNYSYTDNAPRKSAIVIKNSYRINLQKSYLESMNYINGESKILSLQGDVRNLSLDRTSFFQNALKTFNDNIDISLLTSSTDSWTNNAIFGDVSTIPAKSKEIFTLTSNNNKKAQISIDSATSAKYGDTLLMIKSSNNIDFVNQSEASGEWNAFSQANIIIAKGITSNNPTLLSAGATLTIAPNLVANSNRIGLYIIMIEISGYNTIMQLFCSGPNIFEHVPNTAYYKVQSSFNSETDLELKFYIYPNSGNGFNIHNNTGNDRNISILPILLRT